MKMFQCLNIYVYFYRGRSVSSEQDNSESEHSEKSPLVKLDSLAKLLFSRSLSQVNGSQSKENSPTRLLLKHKKHLQIKQESNQIKFYLFMYICNFYVINIVHKSFFLFMYLYIFHSLYIYV